MADEAKPTASIAVPLNEDGSIGALPDPLQKFFDAKIAQVSKRFEAKTGGLSDPVERERLRQLEEENQRFRVSEAERDKRYEEALKMREDEWSRKFKDAESALERRGQRIAQLVGAEVRNAALRYGARAEAVEDIEALLDSRIAINDDLQAVVINAKGEPTDQTVDDLVKATLDAKQYLRATPTATGGGARGGASTSGGAPNTVEVQLAEAEEAYGKAPTPANLERYLALKRSLRVAS